MDEKTKQVQVRLTPELHKELRKKLLDNDSSLVEFFNNAAMAYIKNDEMYEKTIKKINGGKNK